MKKLIVGLNIIVALYFFVLANFFFWSSFLVVFVGALANKPELLTNLWILAFNILLAPFLIYGSIIFFQKTKRKYVYGLILLFITWTEYQTYRFFFVTNKKLESADFSNLLIFGIPFAIICLTKHLNNKRLTESKK